MLDRSENRRDGSVAESARTLLFDSGGIISSKLRSPRERSEHIVRQGLLRMLEAARGRRLILVSAPAGYGKTTLLAQWTRHSDSHSAWVTLERGEKRDENFWSYVLSAIDQALPGTGSRAMDHMRRGGQMVGAVLPQLLASLAESQEQLTLVLDDYQEACSPEVDESLAFVVAHCPPNLQIVLSTRADPVIPLSRWRLDGDVVEIRQDELRFSVEETEEWFENRLGLRCSRESTKSLVEATEGWAAALYLSSLGLRAGGDSEQADDRLVVRRRVITEYVHEETLKAWSPEVRTVMCRVSPLGRFCGDLLDFVFDMKRMADQLQDLQHGNLMFSILAEEKPWYRLHPLLAEVLQAELRTDEPEMEKAILQGAAIWHADQGHDEEAIDSAIRSGDFDLAAILLNGSFRAFTRVGQSDKIRSFLARIPSDVVNTDHRLLITQAWTAALDADWVLVESSLDKALALRIQGEMPDGMPSVEAAAASLRSVYPHNGTASMRRNSVLTTKLIPNGHPFRVYGELGAASAADLDGNIDDAQRRLRDSLARVGDPAIRASMIAKLALYDTDAGNIEDAEARLTAAGLNMGNGAGDAPLSALVATASGELLRARGRTEEGVELLEKGAAFPQKTHLTDHLEAAVRLSRAKAAMGLNDEAKAMAVAARSMCIGWGGAGDRYLALLPHDGVRLASVQGPGGDRLSDAELRVLERLAATHLTKPEIAAELHLSLNTIKSHVRSIYVKLDVDTREGAIQAAGIKALPRQR